MKQILAVIALALLLSNTCLAQGAFLERGAYGVLIGGSQTSASEGDVYVGRLGLSFAGTVDGAVEYGRMQRGTDSLGYSLTGRSVAPVVSLHLIKQGTRYPFSLSSTGSYRFGSLESRDDAGEAFDVSDRVWRIGGLIHTIQELRSYMGLRLWGGFAYVTRSREYELGAETLEVSRKHNQYSLGAELIFMPFMRSVLFVGPELVFEDRKQRLGVTAGLVFR